MIKFTLRDSETKTEVEEKDPEIEVWLEKDSGGIALKGREKADRIRPHGEKTFYIVRLSNSGHIYRPIAVGLPGFEKDDVGQVSDAT